MIDDYKDQLVDKLLADPWFSDIPVLNEKVKDLDNEIDKALNKVGGISAFVAIPKLKLTRTKNLPYPRADSILVMCRIFENPILNATGKTAAETALKVAVLWQNYRPDAVIFESLVIDEISLANDPKYAAYDVIGYTAAGWVSTTSTRLATPEITDNAGMVTLDGVATPGAAIFYTLGTPPATPPGEASPRNGTLYTAPFAVSSGQKVRSRAWLAGYLTSYEASYTKA